MEISEVRVCLKEGEDKKLKAYITVTFDKCFVVRDIKVIDGTRGLFVAMPSRKLKKHCPSCQNKNLIRSKYCSFCGKTLFWNFEDDQMNQTGHRDIAHPILPEMRKYLQDKVLDAYTKELMREKDATEGRKDYPSEESSSDSEIIMN